jgi:hypothetical protein
VVINDKSRRAQCGMNNGSSSTEHRLSSRFFYSFQNYFVCRRRIHRVSKNIGSTDHPDPPIIRSSGGHNGEEGQEESEEDVILRRSLRGGAARSCTQ